VSDQKQLESQLRQAQKWRRSANWRRASRTISIIAYGHPRVFESAVGQERAGCGRRQGVHPGEAGLGTRVVTDAPVAGVQPQTTCAKETLSLAATIARLQGMLSHALGETIQIECDFPAGLPCINADESNIEQVIMNLALNRAGRHAHRGQVESGRCPGQIQRRGGRRPSGQAPG